jgi:methionyl-tRNA formyltransferase
MTTEKKIILLAADCESSRWVYNVLKKHFEFAAVIVEKPVSKKLLFKNRVKRIGFIKTLGQALFSVLVVPVLKSRSKKRKAALKKKYNLKNVPFPQNTFFVETVNSAACIEKFTALQPDVVLVNGTRIISNSILKCTNAVFINMHTGITPYYRGSHGGYWALYKNDAKNFGTTIHIVDAGVDTGGVIAQVFAVPEPEDNFTTYPALQAGIGIEVLPGVINKLFDNNYTFTQHTEKGKLYYQPAIWEYFKNNKVK